MDQHPEFNPHPSHLQRAWPLGELNPVFGLLGVWLGIRQLIKSSLAF
jgi:hypothetical protein